MTANEFALVMACMMSGAVCSKPGEKMAGARTGLGCAVIMYAVVGIFKMVFP